MRRGRRAGLAAIAVAACLALALASCGAASAKPGAAATAAPGQDVDLVVYSSHPADLAKAMVDEFRERTGLRVRVVTDGTGALLERLRAEGPVADVFWGGGAESLAANMDLFQPYLSPERAAIPPSLRDEDGYWTGFSVLPMVIIVNGRLVPPSSSPRRWSDLASPAYAGSVAYADPASSGSAYTILRTMLVANGAPADEEGAWEFVRGFIGAIGGEPLSESSLVYEGVASGEYLVGVTYENAGSEEMRLGSDVRIVYPEDGTSALPDGVAIVAGAPHLEAARGFVDFVLGADVARVVSAAFKRRSARFDTPAPKGLPPLSSIPLLDYDFQAAASEREATIVRFSAMTGSRAGQ